LGKHAATNLGFILLLLLPKQQQLAISGHASFQHSFRRNTASMQTGKDAANSRKESSLLDLPRVIDEEIRILDPPRGTRISVNWQEIARQFKRLDCDDGL
jgi:hypothetical protein